jgi:hypothetical protein
MSKIVRCEVYSRIVGYFRPVQNWNDGKRQEFSERVTFDEKLSIESPVELVIPATVESCSCHG